MCRRAKARLVLETATLTQRFRAGLKKLRTAFRRRFYRVEAISQ